MFNSAEFEAAASAAATPPTPPSSPHHQPDDMVWEMPIPPISPPRCLRRRFPKTPHKAPPHPSRLSRSPPKENTEFAAKCEQRAASLYGSSPEPAHVLWWERTPKKWSPLNDDHAASTDVLKTPDARLHGLRKKPLTPIKDVRRAVRRARACVRRSNAGAVRSRQAPARDLNPRLLRRLQALQRDIAKHLGASVPPHKSRLSL